MHSFSMTKPDDWHVHFRDNEALHYTVAATAKHFGRALVMPNLQPALTTISAVNDYHQRILAALNGAYHFSPYMTLYLNENVMPDDLQRIVQYPHILGAKLYPAGATTNSSEGVHSIKKLYPLLEIMQANDLVLQIHGEVTHGDIFDREALFIKEFLAPLTRDFPKLRMVLEHISTKAAVEFVLQAPKTVAATITPHHLFYNRNQLLAGGLRPHYYCLPILKREPDQRALQQAAVSGNSKFFAGTDSAPHAKKTKESACGCAGIYSAPYAVAMYTQVFDELEKMNQLNHFMSVFGAHFYHLSPNQERIELIKKEQHIPSSLPFVNDDIVPIAAGDTLQWSVHESA